MPPLQGIKVVEMAGLAPVPYAGMILADFGADVVRVDRLGAGSMLPDARGDCLARGKRSIAIDLKNPRGVETLLKLASHSDVLVEPFRPGVMEKLGLGPEVITKLNTRIVYARLTGFGQEGPYANMAGHDINYIAMSGVLGALGQKGGAPQAPINLLGDFAGGGMTCALGILLALFERERSGRGQVLDSAMVDGAASLGTFLFGFYSQGMWRAERGTNLLDGAAHFYRTYETADGLFLSVGAIEPQFYSELMRLLDLAEDDFPHQMDQEQWPRMQVTFAEIFKKRTRDEWMEVFAGSDACVAPVLGFDEAPTHPHNAHRGTFVEGVKGSSVPGPAPRLARTPGRAGSRAPLVGEHGRELLVELGLSEAEVDDLQASHVVG
ncbi:MAG: CaiB/BaiF CoA transferase family protein [Candidatus Binatia bacterium]